MDAKQIAQVLRADRSTRPYFQGVFPSDRLPIKVAHYPSAIVANVDPYGKPGTHWCAFYITQDHGYFMDSYGMRPQDYTEAFKDFLDRNCKQWTYNTNCLQSLNSTVCGQYCLYFLLLRCRHFSSEQILSRFSKNTQRNDRFVYRYILKYYGAVFKHRRLKNVIPPQIAVTKNKNTLVN